MEIGGISMNENYNKIALILANGPSVSSLDLPKVFSKFKNICVLNAAIFHLDKFPRPPDYCLLNDGLLAENKEINSLITKQKDTEILQTKNFNSQTGLDFGELQCDILSCAIRYFSDKELKKIVIFGLDYNYSIDGTYAPTKRVDQHYTIGGQPLYQGSTWTFPKLSQKNKAMNTAKIYASNKKVKIENATKDSRCDIFPQKYSKYVDFYQ